MAILRVRQKDGTWAEIPALVSTGDMEAAVYDPQHKNTDIFAYVDKAVENIPTPDVSGQLNAHNENAEAHADIRQIAHNAASLATSANATAEAASRNADWAYEEATGKASIFYCYADSTELWEIDEQVDNGNIVILNDIDRYVPLVSANYGSSYLFRGAVDDTTVISAFVDSDGWTVTESEIGGGGGSSIPEDHASTETIYGRGTSTKYGHVKLSDATNSTYAASAGIAASPYAVKSAYDKAVTAQTTADEATAAIPTKTSQLTNDSGYITSVPVSSVNGKTGEVQLSASDVGALPLSGGTMTGELRFNGKDVAGGSKIVLETGLGQITNSSTQTLFGFTSDATISIGHNSYVLALRGKGARPTYNNSNMALLSDVPSTKETWTFTLEDGSTVTKAVYIG